MFVLSEILRFNQWIPKFLIYFLQWEGWNWGTYKYTSFLFVDFIRNWSNRVPNICWELLKNTKILFHVPFQSFRKLLYLLKNFQWTMETDCRWDVHFSFKFTFIGLITKWFFRTEHNVNAIYNIFSTMQPKYAGCIESFLCLFWIMIANVSEITWFFKYFVINQLFTGSSRTTLTVKR